jgi:hypothetical protein
MKTIIIILVSIFAFAQATNAQREKFTAAMTANLEKARKAETVSDLQDLANSFERIAAAEKKEWSAWYYAAFYNLMINFQDSIAERKTKLIDLAQQQIENGLKIKPDETELMVLKVMSYYAEMAIDPMLGMTLMGEANALIDQAKSINPDNPRIYLLQAEAIYNMPAEYGGGKEKARPTLLLAKERFEKFVPADPLAPDWGKDRCESMLAN